jgi:hypothetical protein
MLDKREGDEKNISASTLDKALDWLVKQGDVGERQLMEERGKPKVYWRAYKPPGDGAKPSDEDAKIYSHQTPSYSNGFGENKSESENGRSVLGGFAQPSNCSSPEEASGHKPL